MAKIIITIEDEKDEENNPKVKLEFSIELSEIEDKYYASLEMSPETLAEKLGFSVWKFIKDTHNDSNNKMYKMWQTGWMVFWSILSEPVD